MCAYAIKPDMAIITDVNFGSSEGDNEFETVKCGKGAAIDVSSLSDRKLTRGIMKLLDRENIPYQVICEPTNTGTNNELVSVTGLGIPTVVMSVPLRSMHTPVETLNVNDISSLSNVLKTVAYTGMEAL
jgi:endoglucanase